MRIAWHYWCGTKSHPIRYIKYLLISIGSLIDIGKVNPKDIYVTIDSSLLQSNYGNSIKNFGVNILEAPVYPNYSKQIGYYNLLNSCGNDIDKLVQIDCDTIITDPDILIKISNLNGCVNIDSSGHLNLYETIIHRDGQKQKGNSNFSISPLDPNPPHSGDPIRYSCFRDLLSLVYDIDLDNLLEKSKSEMLPIGYCYVLSPKDLPKEFFKFLSFFNFFFEDDEAGLAFAKFYFNLKYSDMNSDHINRNSDKNIIFNASTTDDFNRLKGIVHFPNKDDLLDEEMTQMADDIIKRKQ
jgi:hypothetical protein